MATTTATSIVSFDDAVAPTKKPTTEENNNNNNNNHHHHHSNGRVPGVHSLITPITSEGSTGSKNLLRAQLKKLGEKTKSKLVPKNALRMASHHALPRYLEVEILPLLLCGVYSLADVALSARKEMERGYVKVPRSTSSTAGGADRSSSNAADEISLSLPILHLQSSNGKRKKIIGWDKNQSKPLRVFIDTESKAKVYLEYGIVGHDPGDLCPLGTVEVPVRYKTLGPSQLHLNLKKRPLWPAANGHHAGGRIVSTEFRLSSNARLSLQLEPKEAKESDLVSVADSHTDSNLSLIDEDEQEIVQAIASSAAAAVAAGRRSPSPPVAAERSTTVATVPAAETAKTSRVVAPSADLPAEAAAAKATQDELRTVMENSPFSKLKTTFAKKPSPLLTLFGCLCANNDNAVVEQDEPKTRQDPPESPKVGELPVPWPMRNKAMIDLEDNSVLETVSDIEANQPFSPSSAECCSVWGTASEVAMKPVIVPEVDETTPIVRSRSPPSTRYDSECAPFVQLRKGKDYTQPVKLPMSFSSTTGSVSAVSYRDTEHVSLHGMFCYALMPSMDDEDEDQGVDSFHDDDDDNDDDDDDVVGGEDEDDSSEDEADYSSRDGGRRTSLPEPAPAQSVTATPFDTTTTTSIARQSSPQEPPPKLSPLQQLLSAFKVRCTLPDIDEVRQA